MKLLVFSLVYLFGVGSSFAQQTDSVPTNAENAGNENSPSKPSVPAIPWSVLGTWRGVHPEWAKILTFSADGRFFVDHVSHQDFGNWKLEAEKDHVNLVLDWDDWDPETVTMVGPNEFSGQVSSGKMTLTRTPAAPQATVHSEANPAAADTAVKVLAASYSFGSLYADVTARVRELLSKGQTFQANPECLLTDPKSGWNKALVIFCEVNGKRAIFSVGEGENVSRDLIVEKARPVTEEAAANAPSTPNPAAVSPVGRWTWQHHSTVNTINADGTVVGAQDKGTWRWLDQPNRKLQIDWESGFVDTLNLSADGKTMHVVNNAEDEFTVSRVVASAEDDSTGL